MPLPAEKFTLNGYDLAAQMQLNWSDISQAAPKPLAPSDFEEWLTKRIEGIRGQNWIDQLELNVASRACEVFGLRLLKGPHAVLSCHHVLDWSRYADAGFQIMKGGVGAFECALSDMLRDDGVDRRFFSKVYGPLTTWLDGRGLGYESEPLRSVVRTHIFKNVAVHRGVLVLGRASVGKTGNIQSVNMPGLSKQLTALMIKRGLASVCDDGNVIAEGFVTQTMIAAIEREKAAHRSTNGQQAMKHDRTILGRPETETNDTALTTVDVVKRLKITKPTVLYLCRNGLLA